MNVATAESARVPDEKDHETRGLSSEEAARRLAAEGPNELPTAKRRGALRLLLGVVSEPMILLLLGCGGIYLAVGDRQEALILLGFVGVVLVISYFQERKAEHSLRALRDLASPRALVLRDGKPVRVAGREVVRGDVLLLQEGDRVPADAALFESVHLAADESLLTGESVPVDKTGSPAEDRSGDQAGEKADKAAEGHGAGTVYSGTLITRGHGEAVVRATGGGTALGRIGKALATVTEAESPLTLELNRMVRVITVAGLALCAVIVLVYGLRRGDWLKAFLSGLTLAMSVLPEEIPMILTLFMAIGAHRIARQKVLTRRMDAIETLGAATILCVDKTGTLTQNRMAVQVLADGTSERARWSPGAALPEEMRPLLQAAALACPPRGGDPMDAAVRRAATENGAAAPELRAEHEYPLTRERLALAIVWSDGQGGRRAAVKGAPEAVAALCKLPPDAALLREAQALAAEGLRVLAVAACDVPGPANDPPPEDPAALPFAPLGLCCLADPVRPEVPAALRECYGAALRVVMITCDYPATAQRIARDIGLAPADRVLTGDELNALSDDDLQARVRDTNIFARVVPEQKLRLVQALQRGGAVVAMTGDGVNDAPALKAAHIGVAMGARGTDVAREAAALTLVDDNFASIVAAVRLGRRIYDNLRSAVAYTIAIHVPIAGLSLVPVLLGWPLLLLPVHIAALEMIIDPACSLVFEGQPESPHVMRRPPRPTGEPLLTRGLLTLSLLQGLLVLGAGLAVCALALPGGGERARALTFASLVSANIGLIITNLSHRHSALASLRRENVALWWLLAAALTLGLVVFLSSGLQKILAFAPVPLGHLLASAGVGVASVLWFEGWKALRPSAPPSLPGSAGPAQA